MQKVQKGLQGYIYLPPSFFPNLEAAINRMSYEQANDISGLHKQVCECVLFVKTSMEWNRVYTLCFLRRCVLDIASYQHIIMF